MPITDFPGEMAPNTRRSVAMPMLFFVFNMCADLAGVIHMHGSDPTHASTRMFLCGSLTLSIYEYRMLLTSIFPFV